MAELIRTTVFGQLVRILSNKRLLRYEEESNPALALSYQNKSATQTDNNRQQHEPAEQSDVSEKPSNESLSASRGGEPPAVRDAVRGLQSDIDLHRGNDPENARDPNFIDWYGPDDPENPLNWSTSKKFFVTFQICLLTIAIYTGSSIYTPAIPDVAEVFGVSEVAAVLGLTLFVLGYGLGPMLWSPMSEVPFIGRCPVYIGTLAVFVALQGALVTSKSFGAMLVLRFLTGFFGSPVLATGGATCSDMYLPKKRAYAISIWGVAAVCGPALGPVIGGYVTEYGVLNGTFTAPWEWPMYTLMWLSAACFIFLFFFLPETSSSNILFSRAKRLRNITGNQKLLSQPELDAMEMQTSEIINMVFIEPFTINFTEPMVFFLNLYIALVYGLLYIWFESFPIVFIQIYGFTLGELGLTFLGILVGVIVVIPPFFWWIHKYLEPKFNKDGQIVPEERLPACFVGAFCIPICLFWFGWTARADIHWIVPIIGTAWFSIGSFLLFIAILNYLPDAYPKHIPSVMAGNDLFRSCFGAGFPLFAGAMYRNLGIDWASSTLAFISIAFIPIPFVLYKYGALLRNNHSKLARKDL